MSKKFFKKKEKLFLRLSYLSKKDLSLIERAFDFAACVHSKQLRASGDPFFLHPFNTALILSDYKVDAETISAALLHDVLEDTSTTSKTLKKLFGEKIFFLVSGVTNLHLLKKSKKYKSAKNLQKLIFSSAKDFRILLIKLADKLHNMRTISYLSIPKQKRISRQVLDVYCPLAHKLGMHRLKFELEDLAFKVLYPKDFARVYKDVLRVRSERLKKIESAKKILSKEFKKHSIKADFLFVRKGLYSIFSKMQKQKRSIETVNDVLILNVLVPSVTDCYRVLGICHSVLEPLPSKFKDHIASPENGIYQALHTVVKFNSVPLKIYIQTPEMYYIGEFGFTACNWFKTKNAKQLFKQKLEWLSDFGKKAAKTSCKPKEIVKNLE